MSKSKLGDSIMPHGDCNGKGDCTETAYTAMGMNRMPKKNNSGMYPGMSTGRELKPMVNGKPLTIKKGRK